MKHYRELDWPRLTDDQALRLVDYCNEHSNHPIPQLVDRDNDAILLDPRTVEEKIQKYRFLNSVFPYRKNKQGPEISWPILMTTMVKVLTGKLEPHIDISRKFGLYYVIQGEADSVWYRTADGSAPIAGKSYIKELEQGQIIEVERTRFKSHTWYLYDFGAIHATENAVGGRIGLGVAFPPQAFGSFDELLQDTENSKNFLNSVKYSLFGVSHNLLPDLDEAEIVRDLPPDYVPGNQWGGRLEMVDAPNSVAFKFVKE
jgi:hypothetical protein